MPRSKPRWEKQGSTKHGEHRDGGMSEERGHGRRGYASVAAELSATNTGALAFGCPLVAGVVVATMAGVAHPALLALAPVFGGFAGGALADEDSDAFRTAILVTILGLLVGIVGGTAAVFGLFADPPGGWLLAGGGALFGLPIHVVLGGAVGGWTARLRRRQTEDVEDDRSDLPD